MGIKNARYITLILLFSFGALHSSLLAQTFKKEALKVFSLENYNEGLQDKRTVFYKGIKTFSFSGQLPVIYESANLGAAQAVNNDQIWSGGTSGLSLSGKKQIIGYWDQNQPRLTHQEYSGRVTFEDSESGTDNSHATQMVGTILAKGVVSEARGMADSSSVEAYNWTNDISEMAAAAADTLLISSHPYFETAGWTTNTSICGSGYTWFSLESVDLTKAYQFGYYDSQAEKWDSVAYLAPDYLIIKAAGNQRGTGPASQPLKHWTLNDSFECVQDSTNVRELNGGSLGYETVNAASVAKNILVVGGVESSTSNFDDLSSISSISGSGFGPTDDGRIKPDIVAPGSGIYTSSSGSDATYATASGTSSATSVVTGSVALLRQHYQNLNSDTLSSASIRALLAHTADDVDNEGPDYKTGWGLLNTERAARFISSNNSDNTLSVFKDTVLADGGSIQFNFTHSNDRPLIVTIAWTDPKGTPSVDADDPTDIKLVNDIDLSVTDPDMTSHSPWLLDRNNPANLATQGDNDVDNIEQVYISDASSGSYSISISHEGSLQSGSQRVSILVSEAEPEVIIETIADGNWSNSSTWSGGAAPSTSFQRAKLKNAITLDSDIVIRGITFDGSSSELELSGQTAKLYGGVYHTSGGLGFSGDTTASLEIKDWDSGSDSLRFKSSKGLLGNLSININDDTLALGSSLEIYKKLSLESGLFNVESDTLKLISNVNNTAYLTKGDGSLSGDLFYSRQFDYSGSGWRLISSPVSNSSFSSLNNSFFTQGGAWATNQVSEPNSSLWIYNSDSQEFSGHYGSDSTFTQGEGYLFYMFDKDDDENQILPAALEMQGNEPDSIIRSLYRGTHDSLSYNLAGNPFAGTLDWHEIVSSGTSIGSSYAIWDPEGDEYKYYSSASEIGAAGRYIGPVQGFFVQALDSDAELKLLQSHKSTVSPNKYGKEDHPTTPYINLKLLNGEGEVLDNQAHLLFDRSSSSEGDLFDVLRMKSLHQKVNQVSFLGNENRVNVFEGRSSTVESDEIDLIVEAGVSGTKVIEWSDWSNIPEDWELEMIDHDLQKKIDMRKSTEYHFVLNSEHSAGRFTIQIRRGSLVGNSEGDEVPTVYKLEQNYPNPFNPSTTIAYSLPKAGNVKLEIFNSIGQQVSILVDKDMPIGNHSVNFDSKGLSSGVYFYRIESRGFVQVRSMVLIK